MTDDTITHEALAALSDLASSGEWSGEMRLSPYKTDLYEANKNLACALVNAYRAGTLIHRNGPEVAAIRAAGGWLLRHVTGKTLRENGYEMQDTSDLDEFLAIRALTDKETDHE